MALRTWLRRLVARFASADGSDPARRNRLHARPTLDLLPDRDGPCSLDLGQIGLLTGPVVGLSSATLRVEPSSASVYQTAPNSPSSPPAPGRPAVVSPAHADVVPLVEAAEPIARLSPTDPTPTGVPLQPVAPAVTAALNTAPVSAPANDFTPTTTAVLPAAVTVTTVPPDLAFLSISLFVAPKPSATTPLPPVVPSNPVAPPATPSMEAVSVKPPVVPRYERIAQPPPAVPPSPAGVGVSNDPRTGIPTGVVIRSRASIGDQPLKVNTPVFMIVGGTAAVGPREVPYTLAAHDISGTVATTGAVTLTGGAAAVVTPGTVLAGRSPDILTITLREPFGVRPGFASATLLLAPAQRIADPVLFDAHRIGRSAEAFGVLVRRHEAAVTAVCQRIVGNRADADDVRQFVFLELARFQARFPHSAAGWLRTVARNASLAFLRAKRRRMKHEQASAKPETVEVAPSDGLDENLDAAIRQLPVDLREAVRLRYLEGYTQQEAARIAGCPRGTLSRRAAVGLRALRELLGAKQVAVG